MKLSETKKEPSQQRKINPMPLVQKARKALRTLAAGGPERPFDGREFCLQLAAALLTFALMLAFAHADAQVAWGSKGEDVRKVQQKLIQYGYMARGEPYVGKVAVAAVVLNRVKSPSFPNTIAGVVYQAGAFDAVYDGQINLTPDSDSIRAARDALNGWDPTGGCLYYYNPSTATNGWIWTRTVQLSIGKHNFAI